MTDPRTYSHETTEAVSDSDVHAGRAVDTGDSTTNPVQSDFRGPQLSPSHWKSVREVAANTPLAHPLAFSMGPVRFDYPTPPHLIKLYGDLWRAVMPQYPNAPKQLVRLMPRDHGKSEAGSVVFPTWLALRNPNINILIMMHKEGKAAGKLSECRDHIERLAPAFGREVVKANTTELTLAREEASDVPTIHAAGFKSGVTGGHYDVVIMDDCVIWETQNTEGKREKAQRKFQNYLNLGDESDTVFVVLGTRKHKDDLYSWLLSKREWNSDVKRAVADTSVIEQGEFDLVTDTGAVYAAHERNQIPPSETLTSVEPHRNVPVLWPERYSLGDLIFEYLSAGDSAGESDGVASSSEWLREKQNITSAFEGSVLSEDMLAFVDPADPPRTKLADDLVHFVTLDPAIEPDPEKAASGNTDYWAIAVLGYDPKDDIAYLRDVFRTRGQSAKQAVAWLRTSLAGYPYQPLYVEATQGQEFLVQAIQDAGIDARRVKPTRQKEDRIISLGALFENGRVRVLGNPDDEKWRSFMDEWLAFPTADFDDRLDAVAAATSVWQEWIQSPRSGFNL